ncbi:uncharacterized protein OCT59_003221 [Rhizophagus irregularis]|nr:hypothetical protein OCT59_003221 [Rhizophagus irregularis]
MHSTLSLARNERGASSGVDRPSLVVPKVCQLYDLGESDDPSLSVPVLSPFQLAGTKHRNHNMSAPIDFAIDLLQTAKTVGVTEVKDEDLFKGIAQNAVQLESALSNRKRYFMECSLDDQDRLKFKLSEPGVVVYKDESMVNMVKFSVILHGY